MAKKQDPDIVQVSIDKYVKLVDAESRITVLMQMFSKAESFNDLDFDAIKVFLKEHETKGKQR